MPTKDACMGHPWSAAVKIAFIIVRKEIM